MRHAGLDVSVDTHVYTVVIFIYPGDLVCFAAELDNKLMLA